MFHIILVVSIKKALKFQANYFFGLLFNTQTILKKKSLIFNITWEFK